MSAEAMRLIAIASVAFLIAWSVTHFLALAVAPFGGLR